MTVKQKVTYTVEYDSSTDTLSDKLNLLLDNIINLILRNNSELTELTRIDYGSDEMTGAPLYDITGITKHYQSDVVFLGTDTDNIVLSLCFFNGRLTIAMNMDPSVEQMYVDRWAEYKTGHTANNTPPYCITRAAKWFDDERNASNAYKQCYNVNLPYVVANGIIKLDVVYWNGDYSNAYMFYNSNGVTNGVDLVFYKTVENSSGTQGLGCALWRYSSADTSTCRAMPATILAWSFDENLSNNMADKLYFDGTDANTTLGLSYSSNPSITNSAYEIRQWFKTTTDKHGFQDGNGMAYIHTIGGSLGIRQTSNDNTNVLPEIETVTTTIPNNDSFVSPLLTAYNIPYVQNDDCYLRKLRIPGFNKYCKGELYLFYSPNTSKYTSGDIINVDNKQFGIITEGIVCYAVRIN